MEWVLVSATGRIARVTLDEGDAAPTLNHNSTRVDHDVIHCAIRAPHGVVGAITSSGMAYPLNAESLPSLPPGGPWSLWDAPLAHSILPLRDGERLVGLYSLDPDADPLALGTVKGVVKRVVPEYKGWGAWEVITLKDDDAVIGCGHAADGDDLVFITSDAQLLRIVAREARPQGRPAGGMAGIKLAEDATVLFFGTISKADRDQAIVATLATGPDSAASIKTTPLSEYPAKGRATAGVRTQRFLKGQDHLALAWAGLPPVRACDSQGSPRNLPTSDDRRDGTGTKVYGPFSSFGSGTLT